ncbi:leucine-rich repeat domain-containing protein [Zavarzinella formosa]|uniref:leucine-rich repeat domain-containing protein n=1 Tax=Zavarzinella formosa TaxID=360055 RepID=UPI00031F8651|nr:leucine-rich repeat domain-containing protein [Zavarzinella formosa]
MKTLFLSLLLIAISAGMVHAQNPGERSRTVTIALEKALNKKIADITEADLATVTELSLPHIHLPAFNDDDFAGLTKLKKLSFFSLFHKKAKPNEPAAISGRVFAKLSSLEELNISADQLGQLPDDVFTGLTSLKVLKFSEVSMTRLPKSMLNMPKIETIYFSGKGLSKEDYALLKKKLGDKLKVDPDE